MRTKRKESGFTLLELMVTVVILSILAVVAVASYKHYSMSARTQEAINFLYEIKMKQETYYQAYGQYVTAEPNPGVISSKDNFTGEPEYFGADCLGTDARDLQWCDLGAKTNFNVCPNGIGQCTFYNFATTGWAPGAGDPGSVEVGGKIINPVIRDTSRRWWYAYAEGDLDFDGNRGGFLLTSENNQVIDLWNGSHY